MAAAAIIDFVLSANISVANQDIVVKFRRGIDILETGLLLTKIQLSVKFNMAVLSCSGSNHFTTAT